MAGEVFERGRDVGVGEPLGEQCGNPHDFGRVAVEGAVADDVQVGHVEVQQRRVVHVDAVRAQRPADVPTGAADDLRRGAGQRAWRHELAEHVGVPLHPAALKIDGDDKRPVVLFPQRIDVAARFSEQPRVRPARNDQPADTLVERHPRLLVVRRANHHQRRHSRP